MTDVPEHQPSRRIPLQSVTGATDRVTQTLRLLFLLDEVERQAEVFSAAFEDAIAAATSGAGVNDVWRHLQGALFAGIVINRLIARDDRLEPRPWPNMSKKDGRQAADAAAQWRVDELRRLLALPDDEALTPIFGMRQLRNDLEHVAERLDLAMHYDSVVSVSDWYLSDGRFLTSPETADPGAAAGLRAFWPEAGVLYFDREPLNMFQLDLDVRGLKHNAREAKAELLATLRGRLKFGGGQLRTGAREQSERLGRWREQAAKQENDMAPAVKLDGYVRIWAEIGETA